MKPIIVLSTYPTKEHISKIARKLIESKLAACVNISQVSSMYSWKGNIEDTTEYLAIFKTTDKNIKQLKDVIAKTHPYDVPEIAEIDAVSVNDSYLKWLVESTD